MNILYNSKLYRTFVQRFNEALKIDEFKELTPELAFERYTLFQKVVNSNDGSNSCYELSTNSHEYEECNGDLAMNWKDKGFVTVFDLLQVCLHLFHKQKQIECEKYVFSEKN